MDRLHKFDFCRFCLHRPDTDGKKFFNILNTKMNRVGLRKIILDLLTVNVKECDLLPKIICQCCYTFLVKWFETERKLRKAEKITKEISTSSKYSSGYVKSSAKKRKHLATLHRRLCKKTIENQLIMLNIFKKINKFKKQKKTQKPPKSITTRQDIGPIDRNEPGCCICS